MKKTIASILLLVFIIPVIAHGDFFNFAKKKEGFWYRLGNNIEYILSFSRTKNKENSIPINQQSNFKGSDTIDNSKSSGLNTLPVNSLNTLPISKTKPENSNLKPKAKEVEIEEIPIQEPIINFNSPSAQTQNDVIQQLDPKLLEVAKQWLNTDDDGIALIKDTYQTKYDNAIKGQELCNSAYNNNVSKAKSDAEYLKTTYLESRSGFATSTGALKEIDNALVYDLESYKIIQENCLLKYELPDSSVLKKLKELSNRVSSLRSNIDTPENAVKYQNELESVKNDILSTAGLLSSY